jgi:hypothetical protein
MESRSRLTDTKGTASLPSSEASSAPCHPPLALSSVIVTRSGGDPGERASPSQRPAGDWPGLTAAGAEPAGARACAHAHTTAADVTWSADAARRAERRMGPLRSSLCTPLPRRPNGSRLSCGALKKESPFNILRAPSASSAC